AREPAATSAKAIAPLRTRLILNAARTFALSRSCFIPDSAFIPTSRRGARRLLPESFHSRPFAMGTPPAGCAVSTWATGHVGNGRLAEVILSPMTDRSWPKLQVRGYPNAL